MHNITEAFTASVKGDRMGNDGIVIGTGFSTERRVIELTAMGEVAVAEKRTRVVEEVSIRTEGSNRIEEIRDSVRHTEVDVQEIDEIREIKA